MHIKYIVIRVSILNRVNEREGGREKEESRSKSEPSTSQACAHVAYEVYVASFAAGLALPTTYCTNYWPENEKGLKYVEFKV